MARMIRSGEVLFHADLEPLMVPIDSVHQHPENYNCGDVEALAESIHHNGMYRPIYVQESTGYIIAGNHTWTACKELHSDKVPVVMLDVDHEQALKIMLADNRIASLAMPDDGLLLNLLEKLAVNSADALAGTGYNAHDLEVLKHLQDIPNENDEFGQWPTLTIQVHPRTRAAFYNMTNEADGDRERFELLLRLAGWDGQ